MPRGFIRISLFHSAAPTSVGLSSRALQSRFSRSNTVSLFSKSYARYGTQLRPTSIFSTYTTPLRPLQATHIRTLSTITPTMAESKIEGAKKLAAISAVKEHFDVSFKYVGIGSGTTIIYVVEAIKEVLSSSAPQTSSNPTTRPAIQFIPTGYQSRQVIIKAGLTPTLFDNLPDEVVLDVAFDGADEVDDDLNCIKGGGACLFQEKLVAERARKFVCVADYRKAKPRLLTTWPTIPIEVAPISAHIVLSALTSLGSIKPMIRSSPLEKSGPLKTDQDFYIIDAPFPTLLVPADIDAGKGKGDGTDGTWEVVRLSKAIKAITGVLEVGLFCGRDGIEAEAAGQLAGMTAKGGQKPVAVYFGMQDGSVEVRKRKVKS